MRGKKSLNTEYKETDDIDFIVCTVDIIDEYMFVISSSFLDVPNILRTGTRVEAVDPLIVKGEGFSTQQVHNNNKLKAVLPWLGFY